MISVIGGRGRLGRAISALYGDHAVLALPREVYQEWWRPNSADAVARFFESRGDDRSTVFVAAGLLDPRLPRDEHMQVNYLLPRHVIEGATRLGMRVVTFGTVMERLIVATKNAYVQSKTLLGDYVAQAANEHTPATHIRVHTLYGGGEPSPFMFLGQIRRALVEHTVFEMSPGNQLREYHHLDDEVRALRVLADAHVNGVIDLNHGEPISLKMLARHVFKSFGAESLLRIGALPEPPEENYGTVFERPALLNDSNFRATLPAVVSYLRDLSPKMEKSA